MPPSTATACGGSCKPSSHSRAPFPVRRLGRFTKPGPVFLSWPRVQLSVSGKCLNVVNWIKRLKCFCHSHHSLTTVALLLATLSSPFFFLPPSAFVPSICLLGFPLSSQCCPMCFPRVSFSVLYSASATCFLLGVLSAIVPAVGDAFGKHLSPCLGFGLPVLSPICHHLWCLFSFSFVPVPKV